MKLNSRCETLLTSVMLAILVIGIPALTSCSSHRPAPAPRVGKAPVEGTPGFGGEVVVNSVTEKATVVSIDDTGRQIVLKRSDGRLAHCRARMGVVAFTGIKAGDTVSIGVAEELALAMGKGTLPAATPEETAQVRVNVPDGVKAVADAVETLTFSAKILSIDDWKDAVKLQLANGQTRTIRVSETVNLGDVNPGDEVSVRITDAIALIVQ